MPEMTLQELAAQATDAEDRLRRMAGEARAIVRNARAAQREIQDRWDLSPELKSQGQKAARENARAVVRSLQAERGIYRARIERYVAAASRMRSEGDTAQELRRSRAFESLAQSLAREANIVSREQKFARLVADATHRDDRVTLEALRELAPHERADGVDIPETTIATLDMLAGPPAARAAREMEARATPGANWLSTSIGIAERSIDEPFSEPLELLTADYDRTLVELDPWQPEVLA